MKANLKNINRVRCKLADGSVQTYYYYGKGGPRIHGEPGTPEFLENYTAASKARPESTAKVLFHVLRRYQDSADFARLADRTRSDYVKHVKKIETKFGKLPLIALKAKKSRGVILEWRDELARSSVRQADYTIAVLKAVLSWADDRGLIEANPLERVRKLYRSTRADSVWTKADVDAFYANASHSLQFAMFLALATGQRQGDILKLRWSDYQGGTIRLRQQKTGTRVAIELTALERAQLEAEPKRGPQMVTNESDRPYTSHGFSSSWRKAAKRAGIVGLTFHDLRGTAITRWAIVSGWTHAKISGVSGHSLADVGRILDTVYISRESLLGDGADILPMSTNRLGANG